MNRVDLRQRHRFAERGLNLQIANIAKTQAPGIGGPQDDLDQLVAFAIGADGGAGDRATDRAGDLRTRQSDDARLVLRT